MIQLRSCYAQRWEQELYYRELKLDVRNVPLLASAVIAQLRVAAAEQMKVLPSRMSFFKLMLATQQLWNTLAVLGATLTQAQCQRVWEQYLDTVRHIAVLHERRARSCPRVLSSLSARGRAKQSSLRTPDRSKSK